MGGDEAERHAAAQIVPDQRETVDAEVVQGSGERSRLGVGPEFVEGRWLGTRSESEQVDNHDPMLR